MTPKRQHVTLRPSRAGMAPWNDREADTLLTGETFEGFDDEADTQTEQAPVPPVSSSSLRPEFGDS